MALRFIDSCAHYSDVLSKWTLASAMAVVSSPAAWAGQTVMQGGVSVFSAWIWARKHLDAQGTWTLGVRFRVNAPGVEFPLLGLADGSTEQVALVLNAANTLQVQRGSTVLATGTTAILANAWNYVELKCTIGPAAGAFAVHLNGVSEVSASGVNASASGSSVADGVEMGSASTSGSVQAGNYIYFADFYACDGTGTVNNDFLGDVRVQPLMPSADGDLSQLTPSSGATHYNLVDEVPPDGDASYVSSATAGNVDLYQLADLAAVSGNVYGVQVMAFARKDDAGTRTLAPVIKTGGVEYDGTTVGLGMTYAYLRDLWERNPQTAVPWTIADVNALQAGVKVVA